MRINIWKQKKREEEEENENKLKFKFIQINGLKPRLRPEKFNQVNLDLIYVSDIEEKVYAK